MKLQSVPRLRRTARRACSIAATCLAALALSGSALAEPRDDDDVVLSFATVGDSRQDPVSPDPTTLPVSGQDKIWLQNTKAWSRIIDSIKHQNANFLFFNGDMIMGYGKAGVPAASDATAGLTVADVTKSDLMAFYKQYAYWRGMVAPLMEAGTYVVPVPGNHEVQCKACGKKAQVENEVAWRANMGDLILDEDRFTALFGEPAAFPDVGNTGAADNLSTDQSQLTYSFDFRGNHFVVINTDPVGHDTHAPVQWLSDDLAAAAARGVDHIFVFGHKPAYSYYYAGSDPTKPSGLDADVAARDQFWSLIEQYGATYFCGHEHIFNMMQPLAGATPPGHAWQVLVGSGGSPFDAAASNVGLTATDRMYAWALVRVHRNGRIVVKAYGFDDSFGATQLIRTVEIPAARR